MGAPTVEVDDNGLGLIMWSPIAADGISFFVKDSDYLSCEGCLIC